MAPSHTFRISMRGFNRQDVVRYIEYLNNQHNAQLEQLQSQNQGADPELLAQLEAAQARCKELEAQLAAAGQTPAAPACNPTDQELEAYRRAERAEREAKERAQSVCTQAQSLLDQAALKAEAAAEQFDAICQQLGQYQDAAAQTRHALQETVDALKALNAEG